MTGEATFHVEQYGYWYAEVVTEISLLSNLVAATRQIGPLVTTKRPIVGLTAA